MRYMTEQEAEQLKLLSKFIEVASVMLAKDPLCDGEECLVKDFIDDINAIKNQVQSVDDMKEEDRQRSIRSRSSTNHYYLKYIT